MTNIKEEKNNNNARVAMQKKIQGVLELENIPAFWYFWGLPKSESGMCNKNDKTTGMCNKNNKTTV